MIRSFEDFVKRLREVGFTTAGGRAVGGICLSGEFGESVAWHTGEETDPWRWRIRVLTDCEGIAYAKLFSGGAGYLTREWYPAFLSVRRGGMGFRDFYEDGLLPAMCRRVYEALSESALAYHEIKRAIGFRRDEEGALQAALARLQGLMFVTIRGETHRWNRYGEPYGWAINVFDTTERFYGDAAFSEADALDPDEAYGRIAARVREYNPDTSDIDIRKFIRG